MSKKTRFTELMVASLIKTEPEDAHNDTDNNNVIDNDNNNVIDDDNDNVIDNVNVIDTDYVIEKKVKFMDTHTRTLHYIPNDLLVKLNRYCKQKGDKTEHMTRALTEYLTKLEKKSIRKTQQRK